MRRVNNSPQRKKQRRAEGEERAVIRAARSPKEQLALIEQRRGNSARERRQITIREAK